MARWVAYLMCHGAIGATVIDPTHGPSGSTTRRDASRAEVHRLDAGVVATCTEIEGTIELAEQTISTLVFHAKLVLGATRIDGESQGNPT